MTWMRGLAVAFALLLAACSGGSSSGGTASPPAPAPDLATFLANQLQGSRARGAVLAVITPTQTYSVAAGSSDPSQGTAMQPGDRLRTGSMTKTFTTVAAFRTLERYGASLDSPMAAYVGNPPVSLHNVTFRQALGMTAGMPEYMDVASYDAAVAAKPSRQVWTTAEILAFIQNKSADFPPGSRYRYSNTNFIALQAALEGLSARPLAALVREYALSPAGMQESFLELFETRPGGFGGVTARGFESGKDVTEVNDTLGMGDGGLVATATELARFMKALAIDKSLLTSSQLADMTAWRATDGYGLGLERISGSLGEGWGHSGAAAGFSGAMIAWPSRGVSAALITNDVDSRLDEFAAKRVLGP
jgi:D-alanyl-D-alanine carboxypeptidase